MDTAEAAADVGVVAAVVVLAALAAPYALLANPGTGLPIYYGSGPVGAGAVVFLSLLSVVVLLSGTRGSADPDLAAGVAVAVCLATLAAALVWALAVDPESVFNFSAAWMGWHRWLVVALAAVLPVSAGLYARSVL